MATKGVIKEELCKHCKDKLDKTKKNKTPGKSASFSDRTRSGTTPEKSLTFCTGKHYYKVNDLIENTSNETGEDDNVVIVKAEPFMENIKTTMHRIVIPFVEKMLKNPGGENGVGGRIYMGVGRDGRVEGVWLSHQEEDDIRLAFDNGIRHLWPLVESSKFTFDMIEVLDSNNQPFQADREHHKKTRKVMEIRVKTPRTNSDPCPSRSNSQTSTPGTSKSLTDHPRGGKKRQPRKSASDHRADYKRHP